MQKYEKPEAEIILFEAEDIIRTSGGGDTDTEDDVLGSVNNMFNLF